MEGAVTWGTPRPIRPGAGTAGIFALIAVVASTGPPVLEFSPEPGTGTGYQLSGRILIDAEDGPFAGYPPPNVILSGEFDMRVSRTFRDYVFTDLSTPGIAMEVGEGENAESFFLRTVPGEPVEVIFSRTGRVRAIRNVKPIEKRDGRSLPISDFLKNGFPVFPARPASPGDSWKDRKEMALPIPGIPLAVVIDSVNRLDGIAPVQGSRAALISSFSHVAISGRGDFGGISTVVDGSGEGRGSLHFDLDSGWAAEYKVDYTVSGTIKAASGEKEFAVTPFRLAFSWSLSRIRRI